MERYIEYEITDQEQNLTILQFLKSRGYSHHVIVHLKQTPYGIRKNGVWSYVSERLVTGDILAIFLSETQSSETIVPNESLPFPIVYEDADLLVIDKPADMPIHPSLNNYENSLANAAAAYFQKQGIPYVYRCINRLDRDTSGLTILAKHMLSGAILARNTGVKQIRREYTAIVNGCPPPEGTIDAPIARAAQSALERCVDPANGNPAITHFQRIHYDEEKNLSLVRLQLETGRTHQIRVHMKHLGFPLIGDFLYNPDQRYIKRQALHSSHLSFPHPITGEVLHFSSPLPKDMQILS